MIYSIVIPVYNSEETLVPLLSRLKQVFQDNNLEYEVILVDDNSVDNSWNILKQLKKENEAHLRLIRFTRNYGQHSATFCGLQQAKGDVIITMDDDLQNIPEDITLLLKKQELTQTDLVYGVGNKKHSWWRKIGSNIVRTGNKHLQGGPHQGSSFRLINRSLVDNLLQHNRHFIFLDEVLFWYTNEISYEVVTHHKRPEGKSGYSLGKLVQLAARSTLFYSTWPLKLMTIGGIILSLLSFIAGIYFIILKFLYEVPVQGFTALIVTVFFSTSLVLLCFGIIGTYIKHMYTVLNNKPMFSIAEKVL